VFQGGNNVLFGDWILPGRAAAAVVAGRFAVLLVHFPETPIFAARNLRVFFTIIIFPGLWLL
jgi:hypothetical protein